ncbi:methionyl-tRNA formyltransferase [Rhodobacterales bacterium 52_120_T64]|nr:methionyl-tRNA formyltransferase [Rhodobacterales bacterium 52_120_T64]
MRLIFMGTPDFSVSVLDQLVSAGHEIACVYSQPPRPAGRGKKPRPSPVQKRAEELGLPVRTPLNFKDDADRAEFAALNAEAAVVVAYGLILPQAILDAPERGCFNIHASLLPRWRGAAPIQRAIMAGDAESGVCIMQMEAGLDTGPVLLRETTQIEATDTAATLHDRLAEMGANLIVDTLAKIDTLTAAPQPDEGMTYAAKIDKAEAKINWAAPAVEVDRLIRGISPFPGAWFELEGERVKVLRSELADGEGTAGTVLDDALTVACGAGAVRLLKVQKAGKGPQPAEAFLLGTKVPSGTAFL